MNRKFILTSKSNTKQFAINLIFSIAAFVLNFGISFFITPYITNQFGTEAYGFVKLANDFASYATLLSIPLNSMASRFLMLEIERGNITEARKYYSSITVANLVLAATMVLLSFFSVLYLEKILTIPTTLIYEVKLTFAVTFTSFIVNLLFSMHGNCYYLTNTLSISSMRDALTTTLRTSVIIVLFTVTVPRISYLAIGALAATLFSILFNFHYHKKLTPELKFFYKDFEPKKLFNVISAGIWNSITKLSQIFSSGLDLLLTNLMIDSTMMGYLSVAKTIPALAASFNSTIANVFSPNLMKLYAKNDMTGLKKAAKTAMRFMCLFTSIPNAILITMGKDFFDLWVPGQPSQLINILSVLTIINSCVTGPAQPLYQIFTITNKIKQSSIVMIVYGFVSVAVTCMCLVITDLGVYAVAGVSMIGSIIVALVYHIPYAAKYIGLPKNTFLPEIGKSIMSTVLLCGVGYFINSVIDQSASWFMWFVGACLAGVIGLCINLVLILRKEERTMLFKKAFSLIGKLKG